MQLNVIFDAHSLDLMLARLTEHFGQTMKLHREPMSMFESYQVRFTEKFIPHIWEYRVVCRGGKYFFGTLNGGIY